MTPVAQKPPDTCHRRQVRPESCPAACRRSSVCEQVEYVSLKRGKRVSQLCGSVYPPERVQ